MVSENIQFTTSYNVNLNYPKANLLFRIVAFGFDLAIQLLIVSLFRVIIGDNIIQDVFTIVIFCFWNLMFEIILNGQTIGKWLLGIRIISLNGDNAGLKALLLRWSLKIIDIFLTLGIGAIIGILSTRLNQRLGDIVAGTTLIETRRKNNINLLYLLKLDKQDYTITYSDAGKYTEEEVLLMKEVYMQSLKYNNNENLELLDTICMKVAKDLDISLSSIKDKKVFLKTVIEDYIMLTR